MAVEPQAGPGRTSEPELVGRALEHLRSLPTPGEPSAVFLPDGDVQETSSGVRVVHLRQEHRGIPVHDVSLTVRFDAEGRVLGVGGEAARIPADLVSAPRLDAPAAVLAASRHLVRELAAGGVSPPLEVSSYSPRVLTRFPHPSRPTVLHKRPFRDPVTARLTLFGPRSRLAWEMHFELPDELGEWDVLVAADGVGEADVLHARRTEAHAVHGTVYEFSPGEASRALRPLPPARAHYPDLDGRVLPPGHEVWVDGDRTRGNNVACFEENSSRSLRGTTVGADLLFEPADDAGTDQRLLNAFYLTNLLHDFFFLLGFDEAAGNFQARNFDGVGDDGDELIVRVFDRPIRGIATLRSRRDGKRPELNLGVHHARHTALDADIVIHEFVHGVTNRLIGGRHNHDPLRGRPQPEAMGEGYSDYFALSILNFYRRRAGLPQSRVYGAWIGDDVERGMRRHPYDDAFPGTYALLGSPDFQAAHDAGQVWGRALLELNRALGSGDRERGDEIGWQLVVDSLMLLTPGPEAPTFLDGRDAVLEAFDAKVAGGAIPGNASATREAVVGVFTALGMGPGARSASADYDGIVADFGG